MNILDKAKIKYPQLFKEYICPSCKNKFYLTTSQIIRRFYNYENNINKNLITACSRKCTSSFQLKIKNPMFKDYVKNKIKQTKKQRYNNENYNNRIKEKQTKKQRYNDENYSNGIKTRETIKNRYGVDNYSQTQRYKNLYKNKEWIKQRQLKQYKTKYKNHTFNTSKYEELLFKKLKSKFPDVIHHYYDEKRYPFECDFYIPSKDLFIELNFHWTHGFEPFDKTSLKHQQKLNLWKLKNTKFYNKAIEVWTERDPLKLDIIKKNNLNYKIFYNENEFNKWYISILK